MTDKQLKKLKRVELLQILLDQQKEIERLNVELEKCQKELEERQIKISRCGSIAQASFAISDIFEEAQRVADSYLANVKRQTEEDTRMKSVFE